MNPRHEAHRARIRELAAEHGVTITEEHGGYRVRGRRLDVFVLDLIRIEPHEIVGDSYSAYDILMGR